MDISAPLLDVAPSVRGRLLQVLARLERPTTRRQVASLAEVAPGHASSVLNELVESGLVTEVVAGRASLVALNRAHLAAASVIALAGLRSVLLDRLRERLSSWPGVQAAWLFGSVARADADRDSDIDVLLVVEDLDDSELHEQLADLHADVRSWTGNDLQVLEYSTSSWQALVRSGNELVDQIRADGVSLVPAGAALLARRP